MPKEEKIELIYDRFSTDGLYEEAYLDKNEIEKVLNLVMEDYHFGKELRKLKFPNWRVIFNIHYDVLRGLCDQLMRFQRQKTSNHQALFAFITHKFKDLELDWRFLDSILNTRNKNKYQGLDISQEMWKSTETQFDLYISALKKTIEERLSS